MRLTDLRVQALEADPARHKIYYDDTLKGFGVRVAKGGTKAFVLSVGKNRDRTTIGQYPIVSLAKARDVAKTLLAERQLGRHQPKRTTLDAALKLYTEQHLSKLALRTKKEQERLFKRYLEKLKSKGVADITTADITKLTDKAAPSEAEHLHRAAKTFFRWCVGRRLMDRSPLEGLKPPAAWKPRDRVLTDDELAEVWNGTGPDAFGSIVRVLILTGQRRGEVSLIQPEWIEEETLTFPAAITKNKREHRIPVGAKAQRALLEAPFSFNGWSKAKARLDAKTDIAPWTLHDLRRTFASGLQRLGVRMEVTERYLNHVSGSFGGIAGVYQRHSYMDEMRAAAELWETHIASLLHKAQHQDA